MALGLTRRLADETSWKDIPKVAKPSTLDKRQITEAQSPSLALSQDRVEASPEQLAAAASTAERLTAASGQRTRVVGWVHSHPHITVLPSHVDVATQAAYQQLDAGFVGLIMAVFDDVRARLRCPCLAYMRTIGSSWMRALWGSLRPCLTTCAPTCAAHAWHTYVTLWQAQPDSSKNIRALAGFTIPS